MSDRNRLNDVRKRIAEMTSNGNNNQQNNQQRNNNNNTPPRRNSARRMFTYDSDDEDVHKVPIDGHSPFKFRVLHDDEDIPKKPKAPSDSPSQQNRAFIIDDDSTEDSEIEFTPTVPKAHLNFHYNQPKQPRPDTINVDPGRITRKVTVDREGKQVVQEDLYQGNVPYMTRVADHQYADVKDARRTQERLYDKSEERAYRDASSRRVSAERMYDKAETRKYDNKRETREANLEAMRMHYENQEKARQAELLHMQQIEENRQREVREAMRQQVRKDMEAERRRKEEREARERAEEKARRIAEEERKREELAAERKRRERWERIRLEQEEADRQMREKRESEMRAYHAKQEARQAAHDANIRMAEMDYKDRADERHTAKATRLGEAEMEYADRRDARRTEERKERLSRARELADIHNEMMNQAQERYFKQVAFKDARVNNHIQQIKVDDEQKGRTREKNLEALFIEMGMGDPYYLDFDEPKMSPATRRAIYTKRKGYKYSLLFTGVENVYEKGKDTYVEFLDGKIQPLPKYAAGFQIFYRNVDANVWIIDIFKYPKELMNPMYEPGKNNCNIQ